MAPKMPEEYFELRREQILMAAWKCFSEKGFHETTMRDISQSLGLSTGAVYRYFKGKDAIMEGLQALSQESNTRLFAAMDSKESAREAITVLFNTNFKDCTVQELMLSARANMMLLLEAIKHKSIRDVYQPLYRRLIENVSRAIQKGIAGGEFPADLNPEALAHFLYALLTGMQMQFALIDGLDVTAHYEGIEKLFFNNLWKETRNDEDHD
jgi:AcrR family transcriptional regulator